MRATHVQVEIRPADMAQWLYTNPGAQAGLGATAEAVERTVVNASPVGSSLSWPWRNPIRHGWFKRSIDKTHYRTYWRVFSTDPFAHMVEWGSAKNPAYAPFRRTLRSFGGIESDKGSEKWQAGHP